MKYEKTEWFPNHIHPVRLGVYETTFGVVKGFSYWDGSYWSAMGWDPDQAIEFSSYPGVQNKIWRGLTKEIK